VLVRNATLWTSSKRGVLKNHDLLIADGKIKKIGRGLQPLDNAHVIDAKGRHVTAGLIDAHSHSMILGSVNEGTLPSSAMVSIGDVVNSESPEIYRQLAGGLTVANQLHGSANPIGGQNAIIKLRLGQGPEAMKFKAAPPGIKFALGENVKQSNWGDDKNTRFPQTRMGVPAFHENRFTAAWQYNREWRHFREKGGPPPRRDLELEALGQIIKGERWIHCHSYRQDEILAFMRTMEKFGVRVGTLQHVLEGYKVADEIAAHGAGASCFSDWWAYKYEVIDAIPYAGSLMRERGVVVSFNSDSSDLARRLNLEAAKAVKYGNTKESEALNFVTINPAKQLRVDHRVGSLEVGKDGDFVIWSTHPLSTSTVCLETWIEGKRYFERGEAIELAEARTTEREKLLAKAKGEAKKDKKKEKEKEGDGDDARAAFFRRALETAHGLGVVDCRDCKIENN
jgi:N-acetylglucosamine-6-phosphate deacetylase